MTAAYRKLVWLYPGAFRAHHSAEMIYAFDEDWSRLKDGPPLKRLEYLVHVLKDFAVTFQREWRAASSWPLLFAVAGTPLAIGFQIHTSGPHWAALVWILFLAFYGACYARTWGRYLQGFVALAAIGFITAAVGVAIKQGLLSLPVMKADRELLTAIGACLSVVISFAVLIDINKLSNSSEKRLSSGSYPFQQGLAKLSPKFTPQSILSLVGIGLLLVISIYGRSHHLWRTDEVLISPTCSILVIFIPRVVQIWREPALA